MLQSVVNASDDKTLVRRGVRTLQQLDIKPAPTSSLHRLLVDRFAWEMAKSNAHLVLSGSPAKNLVTEAETIFDSGGSIPVGTFSAFVHHTKHGYTCDPALDRSCQYHEHKSGSGNACRKHISATVATTSKSRIREFGG